MKRCLYPAVMSLVPVIAIAICLSQREVESKRRDGEQTRSSAAGQSQTASDEDAQQVIDVSIIRLIANPEAYDGKFVRVTGVVSIKFENNAVYLTPDDYRNLNSKNAIWLVLNYAAEHRYREVNGRCAYLEGSFNAGNNGHFGAFSGSLVKITRLEAVSYTRRYLRG